jgi:hypothetical protein
MADDLHNRIDAIGKLLALFKLERLIYVIVTLLALIVLLTCAVYLLMRNGETTIVIGLFGSSGAITFTLGRLLKMWNDAMRILSVDNKEVEDGK